MQELDFSKYEEGKLNEENVRVGIVYNGDFYEVGTKEWDELFKIEGNKPENEGTLLGLMAKAVKEDER